MLDPFLGLGSSAIAAAQLGVDFVGVELDRHYLDEAIARAKASLSR
jgi:DNA modification methylase